MKKYLIVFISMLSMSCFVGCDSGDDLETANYVTFESDVLGFGVEKDGSASLEVTVYTSHITGSDRTFSIQVDTTTLDPEAYTLPSSVTVPGNSNEGTFTVKVTDTNVDNAGEKLTLSIGEEQGVFTGNPLQILIARICPFEITGTFVDQSEFYGAEINVEVVAGSEPGMYIVKDLFAPGTDITFTVNPDFSIAVLKQNGWVSGTYGQASVESATSDSGVSSKVLPCDGIIYLALEHTVSAGSFGVIVETLTVP